MTWFQVFINPIVQSTFQADAVRVNEDYLVAIASCFHVQNNAGECRRKSTFLYKISTNTTTSIKCCRSVTRDYPSCTIMSALLPLQRIAEVFFCIIMSAQILFRITFFLHNYVCTNTTTSTMYCRSVTRK